MTTLVFVGPTLAASEVVRRLPDATIAPPVSVGDVLWLARRPRSGVRRIAIIDGYFERMAAVWHKEILVALERGIAVWGAASMGGCAASWPFGARRRRDYRASVGDCSRRRGRGRAIVMSTGFMTSDALSTP
jgi:hypothetical protein